MHWPSTNYTGYAIKFYTLATNNLAGGKDSNGCYRLYGVNIQTRCCADGYWVKLR